MKVEDYVRLATKNATIKKEFENFKERIFKYTLRWEGVTDIEKGGNLHNVPGDSGGYTLWGIAYNHNKGLFHNFDDFADTTYEEAAAIAYIKYYRAIQAFILPENCQLIYFDMAYNMGNKRAIIKMQKCAGVPADGIIGPVTREYMHCVTPECLYDLRKGFYNRLVVANRDLGKFLRGWLNRATDIFNTQKKYEN